MSRLKVYQGATLLVSGSLAEAVAFDKIFTGEGAIQIEELIDAAGPLHLDRLTQTEDLSFSVWRLHDSPMAALQFCAAHRALIANVADLVLLYEAAVGSLRLTLPAAAWKVVERKNTGVSSRISYSVSGGPWQVVADDGLQMTGMDGTAETTMAGTPLEAMAH